MAPGSVVAHVVIAPGGLPEVVAGVPGMSGIAPSPMPALAPGAGIAPGAAIGDVMPGDVMAGDVMRIAGAVRGSLACPKPGLQLNKTMAAAVRTDIRIRASCV
jgi:hypothetical protein